MDKTKLATAVVSGIMLIGAGTFALAAPQTFIPVQTSSEIVSSAPVSSVISSAIKEESKTDTTTSQVSSKESISGINTSTSQTVTSTNSTNPNPSESQETSSYVASLIPQVSYYNIIDPDTGKYVNARQEGYFELQAKLGGDAGKVPTDQSSACKQALAQYQAKVAAEKAASEAAKNSASSKSSSAG